MESTSLTGDATVDARLRHYLELLLKTNDDINLTGAKSLEELEQRHLRDSLELTKLPEIRAAEFVLDVGTGGGLPGIPLAICCPGVQVTLLDATQKKIRAVQEFITALELPNARAVAGRAEELGHSLSWRQQYDVVVSRALAPLPSLLEYLAPFAAPDGVLVAFKGTDAKEELESAQEAMRRLNVRFDRRVVYELKGLTFALLVFRVRGEVHKLYPRGQGLVRKQPIGQPIVPRSKAKAPAVSEVPESEKKSAKGGKKVH